LGDFRWAFFGGGFLCRRGGVFWWGLEGVGGGGGGGGGDGVGAGVFVGGVFWCVRCFLFDGVVGWVFVGFVFWRWVGLGGVWVG